MAALVCLGCFTEAHAIQKHDSHMHHSKDADANFIRDMIPHHQMALDMAAKELKNGKDKEAREMAEKIIEAQKKEIADMREWLKSHK